MFVCTNNLCGIRLHSRYNVCLRSESTSCTIFPHNRLQLLSIKRRFNNHFTKLKMPRNIAKLSVHKLMLYVFGGFVWGHSHAKIDCMQQCDKIALDNIN